jgi:flagellar biosynthesis activator protein FlaF
MTASALAKRAYGTASSSIRTSRGIEYDLFARTTHQLVQAARKAKSDFPGLVKAIHRNRQLWTLLATDVASEGNGLPADLRARIFYLAEFTQTHSSAVLRGEASAAALIELNAAIMRGLRPAEAGTGR